MRQIISKFNIYVTGISVISNNFEKLILNIIFCSFAVLAFLYVLFLGNMVKNIVERQSFEINARTLTNEVRDLEATYLSMSNNVDLNLSYSLGFKNTQATFATRKTLGLVPVNKSSGSVKTVQNDI